MTQLEKALLNEVELLQTEVIRLQNKNKELMKLSESYKKSNQELHKEMQKWQSLCYNLIEENNRLDSENKQLAQRLKQALNELLQNEKTTRNYLTDELQIQENLKTELESSELATLRKTLTDMLQELRATRKDKSDSEQLIQSLLLDYSKLKSEQQQNKELLSKLSQNLETLMNELENRLSNEYKNSAQALEVKYHNTLSELDQIWQNKAKDLLAQVDLYLKER